MKTLPRVVVATLFLVPTIVCAEPTPESSDLVQATVGHVRNMDPAAQQAWLARLEQRAARAARLVLAPNAAAEHDKKVYSQLHQKLIKWPMLREVIADTDAREKEALDLLTRRYEDAVQKGFPERADVLTRRRQAWLDAYEQWKQAGGEFDGQDRLIDWLEAGIENATKPLVAEDAAKPQPPKDIAVPAPTIPTEQTEQTAKLEAAEMPQEAPLPKPASANDEKRPPQQPTATIVDKPPIPDKPAPPKSPEAKAPADAAVPAAPPLPNESTSKNEPPVEETAPSEPAPTPEPAPDAATATDEPESDTVEVKIDELAARIDACNLAIRALEMDLDEKGPWTLRRLDPLVERLELLGLRRNDLDLFREAVPEAKRSSLAPLTPIKGAVSQIAARIVEARDWASGSHFQGTDAERSAELRGLDELSRRLAAVAKEPL